MRKKSIPAGFDGRGESAAGKCEGNRRFMAKLPAASYTGCYRPLRQEWLGSGSVAICVDLFCRGPGYCGFAGFAICIFFAIFPFAASPQVRGAELATSMPRVLPEGKLPDDSRLGPLKTLNGYFPFAPPKTREEWEQRSERVRRQVQVATGVWPLPEKTPLNAVVYGKVDREGYTVEKVYFESYPGHFVTGSLYRPKGAMGKLPGVLCPYGHFRDGRFNELTRRTR